MSHPSLKMIREAIDGSEPPEQKAVLPAEVAALAQRLGACDKHPPRLVQMDQSGDMLLRLGGRPTPFKARQLTAVGQVAFSWEARLRVGPLPLVVVDAVARDACYLGARLFNLIPLAGAAGPDALYRGEAMRYMAELMWNPDAILWNRALTWRVSGERELTVSAGYGPRAASVRFTLDPAGDVTAVVADDRPRKTAAGFVPTPWRAEYSRYRTMGERRIPTYGRVAWVIDGVAQECWRGHVDYWAVRR